jgi:hypothetical protein
MYKYTSVRTQSYSTILVRSFIVTLLFDSNGVSVSVCVTVYLYIYIYQYSTLLLHIAFMQANCKQDEHNQSNAEHERVCLVNTTID